MFMRQQQSCCLHYIGGLPHATGTLFTLQTVNNRDGWTNKLIILLLQGMESAHCVGNQYTYSPYH